MRILRSSVLTVGALLACSHEAGSDCDGLPIARIVYANDSAIVVRSLSGGSVTELETSSESVAARVVELAADGSLRVAGSQCGRLRIDPGIIFDPATPIQSRYTVSTPSARATALLSNCRRGASPAEEICLGRIVWEGRSVFEFKADVRWRLPFWLGERRLAYFAEGQMWVYDLESESVISAPTTGMRPLCPWDPDATFLADDPSGRIVIVNAATLEVDGDLFQHSRRVGPGAIPSPDRRYLVFSAVVSYPEVHALFLYDRDAGASCQFALDGPFNGGVWLYEKRTKAAQTTRETDQRP